MNPSTQKVQYKESVLLVEGVDDQIFSEKLLDVNNIPRSHITVDNAKADGGGYSYLLKKIEKLPTTVSDFLTTVKKMFIAVDADQDGATKKFTEILAVLNASCFSKPGALG